MRKTLFLFLGLCPVILYAQGSYEKAWQAMKTNDWKTAGKFLAESQSNSATFEDSYISNFYLKNYLGQNKTINDYNSSFFKKVTDPFPYTYALWFDEAIIGTSGKKAKTEQVSLLESLVKDPRTPGLMVAGANYQLGLHYLFSANFDKPATYFDRIGSVHNWQLVGPFENISQSGHYKDYGPLAHPEADAVF
ncbi:MAG: hypothetical protein EOO05_21110, partial [Chitinophagaceae bacterium]